MLCVASCCFKQHTAAQCVKHYCKTSRLSCIPCLSWFCRMLPSISHMLPTLDPRRTCRMDVGVASRLIMLLRPAVVMLRWCHFLKNMMLHQMQPLTMSTFKLVTNHNAAQVLLSPLHDLRPPERRSTRREKTLQAVRLFFVVQVLSASRL